MAFCPSCGVEIDPISIRCTTCGRVIARNKQEMLRNRARMMHASEAEQMAMNSEQRAVLNSWMNARSRIREQKYGLVDRVTDLLLNSLVLSMSLLVVFLTIVYMIIFYYPEQSYRALISLKIVEPPTPMVIE